MTKEDENVIKWGINDLAESLGIKPASARVRLRGAGIKKVGRSYSWDTAQFNKVVEELKANELSVDDTPKAAKARGLKKVATPVKEEDDTEE